MATIPDSQKSLEQPLIKLMSALAGGAYGVGGPTMVVNLKIPRHEQTEWQRIDEGFLNRFGVSKTDSAFADSQALAVRTSALALAVLRSAGLPIFDQAKVLGMRRLADGAEMISLAFPCMQGAHNESLIALRWALESLLALLTTRDGESVLKESLERHEQLMLMLGNKSPKGTNTLRFLRAANEANIPWRLTTKHFYQFGWGARQARAQSSIFHTTPSLAVTVARDKVACASVLRQAGLPVPKHRVARTFDDAKQLAKGIGYPVVVKPSDLDGGVGVSAGLQNEMQLHDAWATATLHSKSILVEKHQDGEDFRLIVLDGEMIWAVGRQPAGVTGDGASTIAELVQQANQDHRRGYHADASLRPLQLDEEALSLLEDQGSGPESVLEAGKFVRLRRAANLSSGGTPVVVTDRVHPENKALVERAVNTLGLDLGGVDLIISDISVSWRVSGAAIIEINAQPQLVAASQSHLYKKILEARVRGAGRIPIVVVLGQDASLLCGQVASLLIEQGVTGVAYVCNDGLFVGDEWVGFSPATTFEAGRALLLHQDVSALILAAEDASLLKTGLPFDWFDVLVVVDRDLAGAQQRPSWFNQTLVAVLSNCTGKVLASVGSSMEMLQQLGHHHNAKLIEVSDLSALPSQVASAVVVCGAK